MMVHRGMHLISWIVDVKGGVLRFIGFYAACSNAELGDGGC